MARTVEQVLREMIGAKDIQIATLISQLEAEREKNTQKPG